MGSSTREQLARSFLEAMSRGDGDRVEELVTPTVVLVIGPHEIHGVASVRRMAEQEAELMMEVEPSEARSTDDGVVVDAVRRQRWRESGEIATEDVVRVGLVFAAGEAIVRVTLEPRG